MRDSVIFDLGGVLLDWSPRHLYRKLFAGDEEAMESFLNSVCTPAWHAQHDAGRSFEETREELKRLHPSHAALIDAWGERQTEMFAGPLDDTVAVLQRLAERDVPLYALTNFPRQTFEWARGQFDFLGLFRDIAVSGVERAMKPDARFYRILLERNDIVPGRAVFVDDVPKNVDAAQALGLHGIVFTSAAALERDFRDLGLL